jgi:hypothetical protein
VISVHQFPPLPQAVCVKFSGFAAAVKTTSATAVFSFPPLLSQAGSLAIGRCFFLYSSLILLPMIAQLFKLLNTPTTIIDSPWE